DLLAVVAPVARDATAAGFRRFLAASGAVVAVRRVSVSSPPGSIGVSGMAGQVGEGRAATRPGSRRRWGVVAATLTLGAAAIAAVGANYLRSPSSPTVATAAPELRTLTVRTSPTDAELDVDDKPVAGQSPFRIEGRRPTDRIALRARKAGFEPREQTV